MIQNIAIVGHFSSIEFFFSLIVKYRKFLLESIHMPLDIQNLV